MKTGYILLTILLTVLSVQSFASDEDGDEPAEQQVHEEPAVQSNAESNDQVSEEPVQQQSAKSSANNCTSAATGKKLDKNITIQIGYLYGNPINSFDDEKAGKAYLEKSKSLLESQGYRVVTGLVKDSNAKEMCTKFKDLSKSRVILVGHSYNGSGPLQVAQCLNSFNIKTDLFIATSFANSSRDVSTLDIPPYVSNSVNMDELQEKINSLPDDQVCEQGMPSRKKTSISDYVSLSDLAVIAVALIEAYVIYKVVAKMYADMKQAKNSNGAAGGTATTGGAPSSRAAKISGVVNPPPQAERIAMRNRNRANGDGDGGGLDGGIYMQGAFELKTDANGVVISSNVIIHGTPNFTAVGRVKYDGSMSILNLKQDGIHDVGTLELIVKNNSVSGKMRHGGGKEWIYGNVVGNYSNP